MGASPLGEDEVQGLLGGLAAYPVIVLAVSGGPDSMALLHLAARWRTAVGPKAPELRVATVDHGLRSASAEEARLVERESAAAGLLHATLRWEGTKPATAIQEAGRRARYRLLAAHAREVSATAIITAHSEDDQAETLLMRLARGSGVDGLAGMAPVIGLDGISLVRPLLGVRKARLMATLKSLGKAFVEDPSNKDERYERVRWRHAATQLEAAGLTATALAASARRLGQAREALEWMARNEYGRIVKEHEAGFVQVSAADFALLPFELRVRLLAAMLAFVRGEGERAELSQIESLAALIAAPDFLRTTLAGCLIEQDGGGTLRVFREPGRLGMPVLTLEAGQSALWDGRFRAQHTGASGSGPVEVRALSVAEFARLRERSDAALPVPRQAALAVPAFWRAGVVVAVPSLGVSAEGLEARLVRGRARECMPGAAVPSRGKNQIQP